ncbi:MAG: carboxypeptidase regulatory-like domain-containing protein [Gemmatimonadales bacterium]
MTRGLLGFLMCAFVVAPLRAQGGGTIAGTVREGAHGQPLSDVLVSVPGAQRSAITDTAGVFRLREVEPGWRRVRAVRIGYRPVQRDSVLVRAGETVVLVLVMQPARTVDTLQPIDVTSAPDVVLDPLATATTQRISGEEVRRLPVSTVDEAISLSAGAVGSSYRGGRLGQESFIIDGLQVKNQLDASTGGLGLRVPVDMLTEAALTTNGFSARYGQAISGLVNVVTREGGDVWSGRAAYETDRPAPESWDYGLDRFVLAADGPLPAGMRLAFAADASGRLDADPVNAPAPSNPLDPRSARPNLLPHDDGETYDLAAKLTVPLGEHNVVRLFELGSLEQRLLYDPDLKYDEQDAPGQRVLGNLLAAHWQYAPRGHAAHSLVSDLRVSYYSRDFLRGQLATTPAPRFGGFLAQPLHIVGRDVARAMDTLAAQAPIPGYGTPEFAENTPWGVPAFFLSGSGTGSLGWNHFMELKTQLDVNVGGRDADLWFGGELSRQHVQTFQRAEPYLPVGPGLAPPATAADFHPLIAAGYAEVQTRWSDLAFTAGLRVDHFDANTTVGGTVTQAQTAASPRFAVSTVLPNATIVVSYGRFAQPPDFQYLVDAAFDDTARTGRFRVGNPSLGYEHANQYEFSLRARPIPGYALRLNVYVKQLQGLVASVPFGVNPDSTIFGNLDYGDVKGVEALYEREYADGWGMRLLATLQSAQATATNAYQLFQRIRIAPNMTDTIVPGSVEFPLDYDQRFGGTAILYGTAPERWGRGTPFASVMAGAEGSLIARFATGLPYSRTSANGDTIIGLPNSARLPSQFTLDVLLRRPFVLGGHRGSIYLDVRNLTNRRNVVAVRRDTGTPGLGSTALDSLAQVAYQAHPEPIPYESPRYRAWADANGDGLIAGSELLTLYRAAAQDYFQPLFAFGPPRLVRFGVEVIF